MTHHSTPKSRTSLRIGRLKGAPVTINLGWIVFAAILVLFFQPIFSRNLPPHSMLTPWLLAGGYALLIFFSILLHELAHAAVALRYGWRVTEISLTVWGGYTAYENPSGDTSSHIIRPDSPWRSLMVSLAGPAINILLALLGTTLTWLWPTMPAGVSMVLYLGVYANWVLAAFNLLPGYPLDGGRIIESLVWAKTKDRIRGLAVSAFAGRIVIIGFVALFIVVPFLRGNTPRLPTLVLVLIAASFVWQQTSAALAETRAAKALRLLDIADFIRPVVCITPDTSVAKMLNMRSSDSVSNAQFFVTASAHEDGFISVVSPEVLASVPSDRVISTPANAVLQTQSSRAAVSIQQPLRELVEDVLNSRATLVAVYDRSQTPPQLIGAINTSELSNYLDAAANS